MVKAILQMNFQGILPYIFAIIFSIPSQRAPLQFLGLMVLDAHGKIPFVGYSKELCTCSEAYGEGCLILTSACVQSCNLVAITYRNFFPSTGLKRNIS